MHSRVASLGIFVLSALLFVVRPAAAQGTAFTYHGQLEDAGQPANGTYDLRFTIYDSTNDPGSIIAGPLTNSATAVSNGRFSVILDFGTGVFPGAPRWLQVDVQTNGGSGFIALSPRQALMPVPYSIFAAASGNLTGVLPDAGLSGTYSGALTLANPANNFTGSLSGNASTATVANNLATSAALSLAQVSNSIPAVITNSVTQTAVGATLGVANGNALTNINMAVATNGIGNGIFAFGTGNYTTNVSGNISLRPFGSVSPNLYECFIIRVVPSGADCAVALPPNVHCKGAEFSGQVAYATNNMEMELFVEHWAQQKTNAFSVTIP